MKEEGRLQNAVATLGKEMNTAVTEGIQNNKLATMASRIIQHHVKILGKEICRPPVMLTLTPT